MARWLRQISNDSYRVGKAARDINAVERSLATGSLAPIGKRLMRREVWSLFGRAMRKSGL